VLDADASQRAAIAAALDGRSFVMDGPPGTGKS
jgi:predicted ATPase with chaperone activity